MSEEYASIGGQSPIRLTGRTTSVGSATGLPVWGMGLFGLPFVGFGVWITLMGLEVVDIDPSKVHAPMWIITVAGLVFFFAGLMVWGMGVRQVLHNKKLRLHAQQNPNIPAMSDYPWDTTGYSPPRWQPFINGLGMAVFMTIFLSMFNWWAFWSGDGVIFVKIIVSVFDLILISVWVATVKSIIHAFKFGKTRLEFGQFPYHTGDWFQVKIQLPAGLERVESAKLVFRCVREFYEVYRTGNKRSKRLVHEQLWAEEQELSGAEIGQWPRFLNATFTIPAAAPGSDITTQAEEKPIFWELEMELKVPGVDLKQQYLVPVYVQDPEQ
ncbi:MAG: hypothetical protein AAF571_14205 [Verrucomicrobiota bacterium]